MGNFKYILIYLLIFFFFSCGKKGDNIDNKQQVQTQQNQNRVQQNNPDTASINQESKQITETRKKNTDELTPEKTISALEAKDYIGKVVTVKGYIADVYKSDNIEFLDFEQKHPQNPFTGVIFKEKFDEIGDLNAFLHKEVELTGRVSLYKEKPEIIIKSKSQIIITK